MRSTKLKHHSFPHQVLRFNRLQRRGCRRRGFFLRSISKFIHQSGV